MKFQVTRGPKKDDFDLPATANLKDLKKAYAQKCTSSPPSTQQTSLGVTVDPPPLSLQNPTLWTCGFWISMWCGRRFGVFAFLPPNPQGNIEGKDPQDLAQVLIFLICGNPFLVDRLRTGQERVIAE